MNTDKNKTAKPPKRNELMRLIYAGKYSLEGIYAAIKHERPFRVEFIAFLIILVVVFILPINAFERAFIVGGWILVMATEIINSAFELLCDKQGITFDPIIKRVKDYGSAAVLLLLVNWVIICLVIFLQYL